MGILVTLSLSLKKSKKIFLLMRWSQSTHRSLSIKGLVEKVYRAFIVSVGKIQGFSFVAQYSKIKLRGTIGVGFLKQRLHISDFRLNETHTDSALSADSASSHAAALLPTPSPLPSAKVPPY